MPCCDPFPYHRPLIPCGKSKDKSNDDNKKIDSLKKELSSLGRKYNELKKRADNLTQLLCYACGTFIPVRGEQNIDSRLIDWWNEHNEWDFNRTLDAMKKEFGNGSTTKEEIRKWFIRQAEDVHPLSNYHRGEYFDRVYDAYISWKGKLVDRSTRIMQLEAELAKLKSEIL